jgi:hypothetical protein
MTELANFIVECALERTALPVMPSRTLGPISLEFITEDSPGMRAREGRRYKLNLTWQCLVTIDNAYVRQDLASAKLTLARQIKRAIYHDIIDQLHELHMALHDYDVYKAKTILEEVWKEVT